MMDDLEALIPPTRDVTVGGRTITVTPLRLRQLPGFTKAMQPFAPALLAEKWLAVASDHADELADALAIATGEPRDFIADLTLDDVIKLAREVVVMNADFFARRVMPEIKAAMIDVQRVLTAAAGQQPSPSSSNADTPSTTS